MSGLVNVAVVTKENLLHEVAAKCVLGCRFVTMTCNDLGESLDLIYHFDQDLNLENLRLLLPKGETLPSISVICPPAALVENEIQDFFGVSFTGLTLDYGGKFLLSEQAPRAPLARKPASSPVGSAAKGTAAEADQEEHS